MRVKTFFKITDGLTEKTSSIDDEINKWLKVVENDPPVKIQSIKQSIAIKDDNKTAILISIFYER